MSAAARKRASFSVWRLAGAAPSRQASAYRRRLLDSRPSSNQGRCGRRRSPAFCKNRPQRRCSSSQRGPQSRRDACGQGGVAMGQRAFQQHQGPTATATAAATSAGPYRWSEVSSSSAMSCMARPRRRYCGATVSAVTWPCQFFLLPSALPITGRGGRGGTSTSGKVATSHGSILHVVKGRNSETGWGRTRNGHCSALLPSALRRSGAAMGSFSVRGPGRRDARFSSSVFPPLVICRQSPSLLVASVRAALCP